jgi:P-type Ca2+ transporter type 2C
VILGRAAPFNAIVCRVFDSFGQAGRVTGIAKAVMGVAPLVLLPQSGYSLEATRTTVFLYESMAQLMFAYPSRKLNVNPSPNVWLHLALGLGIALQVLTLLIPGLKTLHQLFPIDGVALPASRWQ